MSVSVFANLSFAQGPADLFSDSCSSVATPTFRGSAPEAFILTNVVGVDVRVDVEVNHRTVQRMALQSC